MSEAYPTVDFAEIDWKPREECGVVGVYATRMLREGEPNAIEVAAGAIVMLQNRGPDGLGVCGVDSELDHPNGFAMRSIKTEGLAGSEFYNATGNLIKMIPCARTAIGHSRYGTSRRNKEGSFDDLHPFVRDDAIALGENAHAENMEPLFQNRGLAYDHSATDSHNKAVLLAYVRNETDPNTGQPKGMLRAIHEVCKEIEGGFATIIMTKDGDMYATRDWNGIRPLIVGYNPVTETFIVASELTSLDAVDAVFIRELEPGEVMHFTDGKASSTYLDRQPSKAGGSCVFEDFYLADPLGIIGGRNIYQIRKSFGRMLARHQPVDVDIIVPVPESAIPAAEGYGEELGIPVASGILRNRFAGDRTFMGGNAVKRPFAVRNKLRMNKPELRRGRNKGVAVLDDTMVRGNTFRHLVRAVENAIQFTGSSRIDILIPAAPISNPCFQGIDMCRDPDTELIARQSIDGQPPSIEMIARSLGVRSLHHLRTDLIIQAIEEVPLEPAAPQELLDLVPRPVRREPLAHGDPSTRRCMACLDGNYPIETPKGIRILPELTQ